ncbi:hypothetical protein [Citrobacter freundii]|uniref:hypothetical protein n=1 Tax=Citrobacter freundii TaxID=546 RepID=UPI00040DC7C3
MVEQLFDNYAKLYSSRLIYQAVSELINFPRAQVITGCEACHMLRPLSQPFIINNI